MESKQLSKKRLYPKRNDFALSSNPDLLRLNSAEILLILNFLPESAFSQYGKMISVNWSRSFMHGINLIDF